MTTPESIVGWLLDHPEAAASDTDSSSSVCDSDTESVSYDNGNAMQPFVQFVSRKKHCMLLVTVVLRVMNLIQHRLISDALNFYQTMNTQCMCVITSKWVC